MVVDLWIYCNPTGNILTTYYSNQIRQGDSFMMRICFPYTEDTKDDYTNMIVKASFSVLNQEISVCNSLAWDGAVKKFPGMGKELRSIGNLIKDEEYVMYDIFVDANAGVTTAYGNISYWLTKVQNDATKNLGTSTINVQKTYGNNKMTYITPTEYSNILKEIETHSVVAKQYMTNDSDYIEDVDDSNQLILKSWCGLGFINGLIKFKQDIITGDEFITIAKVNSSVSKLSYPATVLGVIYSVENEGDTRVGTDVQFRVENDSDGNITLSVSPYSTIIKGDVVSLYGCIPYNGDALKFAEKDADGNYITTTAVVIAGAKCEVTYYDPNNNPEGLEASCTYTLVKDDESDTNLIKFKFVLPSTKVGDTTQEELAELRESMRSTMVDDHNVTYVKNENGVILNAPTSGNYSWLTIKNKKAYTFETVDKLVKVYIILAKKGNDFIIMNQNGSVYFIDSDISSGIKQGLFGLSNFALPCEITIVNDSTVKIGSETITLDSINSKITKDITFDKFQLGIMCDGDYAGNLLGFSFTGITDNSKWNSSKKGVFIGDDVGISSYFAYTYSISMNSYGNTDIAFVNAAEASNTFILKISAMVTGVNFVLFLGGQNDWKNNVILGEKGDIDRTTFYGAVDETFSTLRCYYNKIPIFVSTILHRTVDNSETNNNGNTIEEFNEAIRYYAKIYGLIVVEGYGESGITVVNLPLVSDTAGVLNAEGYKRITRFIKDKMEQYTPYVIGEES